MFLGSVYMSWMLDCDGNHVMGMALFEVLLVWVTLPTPWCNYQIIVKVEIYSLAAPHFMEKTVHFEAFRETTLTILRPFLSFKRVSFKEHSIKTRHNVSKCFALILSPRTFFKMSDKKSLRSLSILCFRQYGWMEWITSHYEHPCW